MKKDNVLSFIALLIVVGYLIFQYERITSLIGSSENAETQIGMVLGIAIMSPHFLLLGVGAAFNFVAFTCQFRWASLTAGILYTIGTVFGLTNYLIMIIPTLFCYWAYAKPTKKE